MLLTSGIESILPRSIVYTQGTEIYLHKEYARIPYLYLEKVRNFANSPKAIYILAECFKNFAKCSSVRTIYTPALDAYPTVFAALKFAQYPRTLVSVVTELKHYRQSWYDRFLNPLSESPHLISPIEYRVYHHTILAPEMREYGMNYNENGSHYSDFKSVTLVLSSLVGNLTDAEK